MLGVRVKFVGVEGVVGAAVAEEPGARRVTGLAVVGRWAWGERGEPRRRVACVEALEVEAARAARGRE